jgi:tetrahedral aminopeptidase
MDQHLFTELLMTPGVSGREERIRAVVRKHLEPLSEDIRVDRLGNIIAVIPGDGPKVMVCAHMDTIGFLVSHVDDDGFLRVSRVGGFDPRSLVSQRVLIQARKDYIGLLSSVTKPIHVLQEDEVKRAPKIDDVIVDVVAPADEIKANIAIGDPISFYREPVFTDHAVMAPYLDDRLGVYALLEALKGLESPAAEIVVVVSVQEEVGVRGARTSAFDISPDIGIAVDVTMAADTPGVDKARQGTILGGGTSIDVMNSGSISDPRLVAEVAGLAKELGLPHQFEILLGGGTDAGAIQLARAGVPSISLGVPTRYVHTTNETALLSDIDVTVKLLTGLLQRVGSLDLSWQ